MYMRFLICIIFSVTLTACATTDDPRKGGFFGGIGGLSSGAYETRVQQRQDELNRQKNISDELKQESSSLENEARAKESELATEQKRLADMEEKLSALQADVDKLKARSEKQKNDIAKIKQKIKKARKRLSDQQAALDELDRAGGPAADPDRYKVLEKERDKLADEFKKLQEYSKALSNAAK